MADTQEGTTREGVHLGAMAGTIELLQRCYTGLETRDGTLVLAPALPDEVIRLGLGLHFRGHRLDVDVDHDEMSVTCAPGDATPATLVVAGRRMMLRPGQRVRRRLASGSGDSNVLSEDFVGATNHEPARTNPRLPVELPREQEEGSMATTTDPVCGMVIEESDAVASAVHDGTTYYFCSSSCHERFSADPGSYVSENR
jgi:YHS domain-containing protein